jgi:hypothetical protein
VDATRAAILGVLLALATGAKADEVRTSTVGMPAKVEQLVIPGPELEVKPIDDLKTPVVIRIAEVYPHGSAFRYDLVYYGIKPGTYDLLTFLRRKDGSPLEGLPVVPVTVKAVLPPGRMEPNGVRPEKSPALGGYRRLLEVGAMAWSAGLVGLLYLTRRKSAASRAAATRSATLADRLKPLVEAAVAGTLKPDQYAELERLLIGYWRDRLGLKHVDPAAAIAAMRKDDDAGPVIRRLEDWLHRPGGTETNGVDVAEWLRPYQDIPAEETEREPAAR